MRLVKLSVMVGLAVLVSDAPIASGHESLIEDQLRICAAINRNTQRLACFDNALESEEAETAAQPPAAPTEEPERLARHWRLRVNASPIDDSRSVFLRTLATETVSGRFGRTYRPTLTLRCRENTTSFIINFDGQFMADSGGYGTTDFRFDDAAASQVRMRESTDNQALGLWSGGQAIPMLRRITQHDQLLVRYTPFNESAQLATFNISGARPGIAQIAEACNWSL